MFGYTGKILNVNLSEKPGVSFENLDEKIARRYLGGCGLAAKILQEMDWNTDPFAPENVLVFTIGPLTGTSAPCCSRYVVSAKSPLTGIWGEAHAAGYFGAELKLAGLDGIIIKGRAKSPVYLLIQDDKVEIKNAEHLWGKDTIETQDLLIKEHADKRLRVACIGPAGEKLSRIASIANDYGRFAARCGLGAVMGSKNLKAIAIRGTKKPQIAKKEEFHNFAKQLHQIIIKAPARASLRAYGTDGLMNVLHDFGDVPIQNFRQGFWAQGCHKVSGQFMAETILSGYAACRGCPIGCERKIKIDEGFYAGVSGKGPEYETAASLGPLLLNDNLEAVAKANELCTLYGLDTISTGCTIAFAMECYEKGLLSRKDTDGLDLTWGNHKAMVKMVEKIGQREGIGDILAEGSKRAAEKIGKETEKFALHVKGLEVPMHDSRAFNSWALVYATSNRGACHISAPAYWIERGITFPAIALDKPLDRFDAERKAFLVKTFQDFCEVMESLVMCKFSLCAGIQPPHITQLLNLATGWNMDINELMRVGERGFNLKRTINTKLGVSRKDDLLPARLSIPHQEGGARGYVVDLEKMLDEYYELRGWNKEGIPINKKQ
ncbi:aldehyde ferredoxin oxidoreductase family protein [Candidatus Aerophobetes bacterium]|nr:aldehyde ferredoxin oxidoreductase family protein [Candidatus Aerophobetes bacterium]